MAAKQLSDLNLRDRSSQMTILGKGNLSRTIPMNSDLKNAIDDYLIIRNKIPNSRDYLLLSERKNKYSRSGIFKIVRKYSMLISTETSINLSPHMFRHYAAKKLLEHNDPIVVARILGHSSIQLLLDYYVDVDYDMMKKALDTL
jgi:integrase/recombinase XerC